MPCGLNSKLGTECVFDVPTFAQLVLFGVLGRWRQRYLPKGPGLLPRVLERWVNVLGSDYTVVVHLTHSPTDYAIRVSTTNGTTSPLFSNGPKLRGCPDGTLCVLFSWGRTQDGGTGQVPADLARPAAAGFVGSEIVTMATTKLGSFAVLLRDGNIRVWGNQEYGGLQTSINFANDARAVSLASTGGFGAK